MPPRALLMAPGKEKRKVAERGAAKGSQMEHWKVDEMVHALEQQLVDLKVILRVLVKVQSSVTQTAL